ncbi:hypothetical protein LCGC14_1682550 [marine sediment metagenome]|uniref:Uncharacterized protein n=1 Tax=marine sediment metagenome TaxID=412755 RepID=A0A0F9HNM1_9ZZZZ
MKANCTDCDKGLKRIAYVRSLRPGEYLETVGRRDPLCYPCWVEDCGVVRDQLAKDQVDEEESVT